MSRLYAIGELLIDFQSVGHGGLKDTDTFVKKAGGAPANVVAQAAKLGQSASYLTKVGKDGFGEFLIESLARIGVDVDHIRKDPEHPTSLAFVSLREDGEREFSFYRQFAADLEMEPEDFASLLFQPGDILEFGSVALASDKGKRTHDFLIRKALDSGAKIAFDPNLRFNLWKDKEELRETVLRYAREAHIIKIGCDELEFVTGLSEEEGVKSLFGERLEILLLTDGSKGARLYTREGCFSCPGFQVKAVDTTGAGDSFFGAFLAKHLLTQDGKETLSLPEQLAFACKAGAYTTTDYGAIPAMGDAKQIERKVH